MQNWGQVTEALAIEQDSAGLATQRFGLYLNGLEATMNRSKAAWEGMWQKTISNDAIKMFYNLSTAVAKAITSVGGLIPVLVAVGVAFAVFYGQQIVGAITALWTFAIVTIPTAIGGLFGLEAAAAATGAGIQSALGPIAIIAGLAFLAISYFANEAKQKLQEINAEIQESTTKYDSLRSAQKTLADLGNERSEEHTSELQSLS